MGVEERRAYAVLTALWQAWGEPMMDVIEGNAAGYDQLAGRWALDQELVNSKFHINRDVDGDGDDAPKRRNQRMLDLGKPERLIVFPGGPGTRHMYDICHAAGVAIYEVEFDDQGGAAVHLWPPKEEFQRKTA